MKTTISFNRELKHSIDVLSRHKNSMSSGELDSLEAIRAFGQKKGRITYEQWSKVRLLYKKFS